MESKWKHGTPKIKFSRDSSLSYSYLCNRIERTPLAYAAVYWISQGPFKPTCGPLYPVYPCDSGALPTAIAE